MRRIWWHVAGRFCEVRSQRAFRKYLVLKEKAEKFFQRVERGVK